MKLKLLAALAAIFWAGTLPAQIRTGFKTGWNSARIIGESELDAAGNSLETWKNVGGFHIGMTLTHKFESNPNFGLRAEILYSKKGSKYTLTSKEKGATFRYFPTDPADLSKRVLTYSDEIDYLVAINNSYIDVPLLAFARFGNFEFSAGVSAGALIASYGEGSMRYKGYSALFPLQSTNNLEFQLDHNYRRDDPGGFDEDNPTRLPARLNNQNVDLPQTIGAYYDYPDDKGSLFNTLDFSAIGGVSYYLSRALYASVRLQYGLSDISNNKADISRTKLDADNQPVLLDRKDRNLVTQISVGFSF